jgi:Icc protein
MASIFNCATNKNTGECYYAEVLDGLELIFLDTAIGKCSSEQWSWLKKKLSALEGYPIVFMHHPPFKAGVRHMDDNYPFLEPEKAFEVFSVLEESVNVFCGHYHVERSLQTHPFNVHITPSTLFALDPWSEEAEIADNIPAYRTIQVLEDGATIRHFVTYQQAVPAPKKVSFELQ